MYMVWFWFDFFDFFVCFEVFLLYLALLPLYGGKKKLKKKEPTGHILYIDLLRLEFLDDGPTQRLGRDARCVCHGLGLFVGFRGAIIRARARAHCALVVEEVGGW